MANIDRDNAERRVNAAVSKVLKPRQREFAKLDPKTFAENGVNPNFFTGIRNDMEEELRLALLLLLIFAASRRGVDEDASGSIAAVFAAGRASEVASRVTANSQQRIAKFRAKLQQRIADDLPIDKAMMQERATTLFGKDRGAAIASMETTNTLTKAADLELELKNQEAGDPVAFKEIWVLGQCRHCTFCPKVSGHSREFWGQFVSGPPSHFGCCCTLAVLPSTQKEPSRPSVSSVRAAAVESGVFGFG